MFLLNWYAILLEEKRKREIMTKLKQISNATNLKFLAIFLMFLDHIHEMFLEIGAPTWLNMLGRLVFPIFLFLAADSFYYTSNRKRYMLRLLYMGWFMTIGNMIFGSLFDNGQVGLANNAFSTFFITGVYICAWDLLVKGFKQKSGKDFLKGMGLFILPIVLVIPVLAVLFSGLLETLNPYIAQVVVLVVSLIPNILLVEAGYLFVILGVLFYIFREKRLYQYLSLALISTICYLTDPASV